MGEVLIEGNTLKILTLRTSVLRKLMWRSRGMRRTHNMTLWVVVLCLVLSSCGGGGSGDNNAASASVDDGKDIIRADLGLSPFPQQVERPPIDNRLPADLLPPPTG
ncbi:MAG: hypothetical protein P8104_01130 [Gammaproteobacteria bacterium]